MMGGSAGNTDPFGRKKRTDKREKRWLLDSGWFEGYSAREEMDKSGKRRFVQYYTGVYYALDVSKGRAAAIKAAYAALFALALALFIGAAMGSIRSVGEKPMALLQGGCVICMLWLLRKLGSYVVTTGRMTVGEYKNTSRSLIRAAKAAALGFACAAAATLVQTLLCVPAGVLAGLLCVLGYLAGALCLAGIAVLESRLKYRETLSDER